MQLSDEPNENALNPKTNICLSSNNALRNWGQSHSDL